MNTKDLRVIVETWLRANGYDGLCHPDSECGCRLADGIMPCEEPDPECMAGFEGPPPAGMLPNDCDWYIYPSKPRAEKAKAEARAAEEAAT